MIPVQVQSHLQANGKSAFGKGRVSPLCKSGDTGEGWWNQYLHGGGTTEFYVSTRLQMAEDSRNAHW